MAQTEDTTIRVEVDRTRCIGSRLCNLEAPEVFSFDEDAGWALAVDTPVPAEEHVWDAVEGCPREAISAIGEQSGEQLFP